MALGANLWKVDIRIVPPAGVTPSPCDFSKYLRVPNGTTAEKDAIARAATNFGLSRFTDAGCTVTILAATERNDLL